VRIRSELVFASSTGDSFHLAAIRLAASAMVPDADHHLCSTVKFIAAGRLPAAAAQFHHDARESFVRKILSFP